MNFNILVFRTELARNCLTMKELSKKSGVSDVTLTRVNQGKQIPQPVTVGKIAKALKVDVEKLINVE